ncbi:hypothetical protein M408DRAFT_135480 [Serendipita vermifera MAFF 305830]|uniref:Uncharacterized protein n=1 Tax=Serendipita vermifera MAFF 305830 TaxID=933852 RepID=A0A0C3A764_SERVB|nr:hypothetical protein M408DRAFT_135480 [Serendipita vermifera MAFF 305830]
MMIGLVCRDRRTQERQCNKSWSLCELLISISVLLSLTFFVNTSRSFDGQGIDSPR